MGATLCLYPACPACTATTTRMKPMGQVFQIAALPRSGTAWISTVLNMVDGCIAFHELAATEKNWRGRIEHAAQYYSFVGDVTTYGFLPKANWPGCPKVFIHRNYEESHAASEKAFGKKFSKLVYHRGEEIGLDWARENGALVIPYSEMFRVGTVKLIIAKVMPWVMFGSTEKIEMACRMNIQRQGAAEAFCNDECAEVMEKMLV